MRLSIKFISDSPVQLPVGYNQYIQGLIYTHLKKEEARWLHEEGFQYEKRRFKLFTFSSLLERAQYNKKSRSFTFPGEVHFLIASPVRWILEQLAQNIISSESVRLGENILRVNSVEMQSNPAITQTSLKVTTISPIEAHSTFTLGNGKKRTHYYTPFDSDFPELINANLCKKWTAFSGEECPHTITISPLFSGNRNEKVRYFGTDEKRTLVKGWMGMFLLKGVPEFLSFALDAGLGSRNSQGFGMVEAAGKRIK